MSTERKYKWFKIADAVPELFPDGTTNTEREINHKKLCLVLQAGHVHACSASCPHAGGRMADGYTDAMGNIVCPIHRYKFNLQNGRNSSGEGYFLKIYPVENRAEGIFVGFEEKNLFDWFK